MAGRRNPRRRARRRPLLGRRPAGRPAPRERLLRHGSLGRAFGIGPQLGGRDVLPAEGWSSLIGAIAGMALIAAAPYSRGRAIATGQSRTPSPPSASASSSPGRCCVRSAPRCPRRSPAPTHQPFYLTGTLALQAFITLVALVGWGVRFAPRRRPRALARARLHAHALRGAASRLPAAARRKLRLTGRLPADARVLRHPRRRLAHDPLVRARTRSRGGARARRARDPRRPRAVPLRSLHARLDARGGRAGGRSRAASEGSCVARAAGGALRDPRALVGVGHRPVRRGATAVRRVPDGGRRARGGARRRPRDPARPGRADRDLPHRPGRPRQRPQACERDARRGDDRAARTANAS